MNAQKYTYTIFTPETNGGELRFKNINSFKLKLDKAVEEGHLNILINMKNIKSVSIFFIASSVSYSKKLRERGGNLIFFGSNDAVKKTFEQYKVIGIFKFFENKETATESLK